MIIINGDRQTGKTEEAIKYCLENKATLVVGNMSMVRIIKEKIMYEDYLEVITYRDFRENRDLNKNYVIDDISSFLGSSVLMFTSVGTLINKKHKFKSIEDFNNAYFSLGKLEFNKEYPNYKIGENFYDER